MKLDIANLEKPSRDYGKMAIDKIISDKIASDIQERSFYVVDTHDIYMKHLRWIQSMPRVKPIYSIRCNNMPQIVSYLASLGVGFDCISKKEIEQVRSCGFESAGIIYSNPCKTKLSIKHAESVGVDLLTFDTDSELRKIAQLHPNARLVLRIRGSDEDEEMTEGKASECDFDMQFGADMSNFYCLLKLAKQLGLNVVGVSVHNGANCREASVQSIADCKAVFSMGEELGHQMTLLDIGGGYPGEQQQARVSFEEWVLNINYALDLFFPIGCGVEIIAEPSSYYVASSMTLVTKVIAKRIEYDEKLGQDDYMYHLNDGVYGAFNSVMLENVSPQPELLDEKVQLVRKMCSSVMCGPTYDSADCIKSDFMFPELQVGEWVVFKNMGAYTCCVATASNGFDRAAVVVADKRLE